MTQTPEALDFPCRSTPVDPAEVDAQQQRDWSAGYGHAMSGQAPDTMSETLAPHYVRGHRVALDRLRGEVTQPQRGGYR